MTPAAFEYHAPRTLAEALGLLQAKGALPLAGGQSLMPALIARAISPQAVVDLNRIGDLPEIELDGDRIRTGALVRMQQALDSPLIAQRQPLLGLAINSIAHRAIRNRGTIVGSLCQLDPWAELPVVACALEASLSIAHTAGSRRIGFGDFASAPNRPALAAGELVVSVDWPLWPVDHGAGFAEVSRRPNDPALVCAAALILLDDSQRARRVALAIGAVTALPIRCHAVEAALLGQPAHQLASIARAHLDADLAVQPVRDDAVADASYRRHLAPIMLARALEHALSRVERHD